MGSIHARKVTMPRAELAVTDGLPPPSGLPAGELITWPTGTDGQFTIRHADPRILISAELLAKIDTSPAPGVKLDTSKCCECFRANDYTEAVLKISGVNRQVVYRITSYVPRIRAYIGEWPD